LLGEAGSVTANAKDVVMNDEYPYEAKRRVVALVDTLRTLAERDPEQEVRGIAVPVLKTTLAYLKTVTSDDPIVQALAETYEWPSESDDPIRAVYALLVACQMEAALGPQPVGVW
jgi:hypothetical protein